MSPPTSAAISQLRHLVHYNLDNDLLSNALFLAGRLHGLDPRSPETVYLVAQCHLRLGHFRAAYDYAKDTRLRSSSSNASSNGATSSSSANNAVLACAYVFAQACLALRRHGEGIAALERCRPVWQGRNHWERHTENERRLGPDAPAVCNLLGKLYRANGEEKKAAEYFAESLKGNPFMWDAFVDLSDAGVPIRTANIFKLTDDLRRDLFAAPPDMPSDIPLQQNPPIQALSNKSTNDPNTPAGYDPFNPTRSAVDPGLNYGGTNLMSRLNGGGNVPGISLSQAPEWDTPIANGNGIHYDDDVTMDDSHHHADSEAPPALPRKKTGLQGLADLIDPPKIRAMTTRGRLKPDLESTTSDVVRPTTASSIPVSHKRTISGQPPPPPPSMGSNAGSDASSQGIRRSTRIQNSATASTAASTAKTSIGSRFAGVLKSDPKEKNATLPKAKATGTRGRAGTNTVGRVVSGNRKMPGPGERDYDSKDTASRPASVASTIRETGSKRGGNATNHSVVIEHQRQQASRQQYDEDALRWLLDLFAKLAEGYFNLSRYNPQKALDVFRSLPSAQRETPWVMAKMGRALYERGQYKESAEVFARVRKLALGGSSSGTRESLGLSSAAGSAEGAWFEDMHIYSTVLWHLKRDIELSYLAHSLLQLDRLAPESWVSLGNAFSLQRDHDKAIKCFRRATQLSSTGSGSSAYAFTLMGHEHVVQEEFDAATACYRAAVAANPRHYAGWYGLAAVYEKLGKYDVAERHYRVAWGVNPRNGVLAVCLGLVCEKLGRDGNGSAGANAAAGWVLDPRGENRVKEALGWYERAVKLDPRSAKARFMRARTLVRLAQMPAHGNHHHAGSVGNSRTERLMQAKAELDTLREMAPEESMVHFLLGRCLKLMGDRAGAIREMTIAMELDPKASPAIKEALESLEVDDDGSFDEDEDD